jgi:hypothetical protein
VLSYAGRICYYAVPPVLCGHAISCCHSSLCVTATHIVYLLKFMCAPMCALQEKAVRVREEALAIREATLEMKEKLASSTSAAKSEQDRQVLHPCLA